MKPARLACQLAAVLTACLVSVAQAEVRLESVPSSGGLQVEVQTTVRGPWSPTGPLTPSVLNPVGDLTGDSMPGWADGAPRVLAAWNRPATGTVDQAIGTSAGWIRLAARPLPGAFGSPRVDALTGAWTVTSQVVDGLGSHVDILATTLIGQSTALKRVGNGNLVSTVPGGIVTWVVILHPDTGRIGATPVYLAYVPTQPIPIELIVGTELLIGYLQPCASCSELQMTPNMDTSSGALLTWWSTDSTLEYVSFLPDGPVLPAQEILTDGRKSERRRAERDAMNRIHGR